MNKQMDFSERLRSARNREDLSRTELAGRAGVRKSSIVEWETTDRNPRDPEMKRLEDVLGVELGRDLSVTDTVKRESGDDRFGEIADLKIRKTTDYDRFIKAGWQRRINEDRAEQMAKDNQNCDSPLIRFNPILVQPPEDGEEGLIILDGQHRFASARLSNDPVYFICDKDRALAPEDIAQMNQSQKSWSRRDWCGFYTHFGDENYQYIVNLVSKHPTITVNTSLQLPGSTYTERQFKNGEWTISEEGKKMNAEFLLDYKRFLSKVGKGHPNQRMISALGKCWELDDWDHDRFLDRIESTSYGKPNNYKKKTKQILELVDAYNYSTNKNNRINPTDLVDPEKLMELR